MGSACSDLSVTCVALIRGRYIFVAWRILEEVRYIPNSKDFVDIGSMIRGKLIV